MSRIFDRLDFQFHRILRVVALFVLRRPTLYSSLRISGYRGFATLQLKDLGRVNLLVGTNNSGKTSILECVELLRATGNPLVLSSILRRRGEWGYPAEDGRLATIDISQLFANRDLQENIIIDGSCNRHSRWRDWRNGLKISVKASGSATLPLEQDDFLDEDEQLVLTVEWSNGGEPFGFPVTAEGFMSPIRRQWKPSDEASLPVQFIRTNGISAPDIKRLFDDVVLTDNEEHVTDALRIIEPTVERIASVGVERGISSREGPGGIFVRLTGVSQRIPIGSAGDGMWRMLGLAVALSNAKGGVLLVDEIDTGLHYSVMKDMWRMVYERSSKLNTQVFATTHSRDCYESLATIVEPQSSNSEITIHRLEPGRDHTVAFSGDEIIAAAKRGIEVR